MTPQTIKLTDIVVGERLRKDYGDLTDLDTIETVGLIQPIVLDKDSGGTYRLIAGGRRFRKLQELHISEVVHGLTGVAGQAGFVYSNELPHDVQREVELYENIGRKSMSFHERILAISEIHQIKKRRAALDHETWGQAETGAEVGLTYSSVSYALAVAERLKDPESKFWECSNLTECLRLLVEEREDLAKRQNAEFTASTLPPVDLNNSKPPEILPGQTEPPLVVELSKMLHQGDMVDLCKQLGTESVDHIITDWPYAIDMDYLEQGQGMNVDRVRAEHDHKDNLLNYQRWLQEMFNVLKPKGFCVVWYDNVHWEHIRHCAELCGFRVQRWPLVWVKTSPCLNQMAAKNFTKATEFAIVLSKQNATIIKPQAVNYWSGPRAVTISNPFAKPKGLWQWILSAFALRGDTILDPFAGEGSSTLATIDYGCRPVAFESNVDHFNQLTLNVRELYTELTKGNIQFT